MEKRFVSLYVDKEKAEEYEQLKTIHGENNMLDMYLEEYKKDFKLDMDSLDEDLIEYKAKIIKWNKALTEARVEMQERSYELWEDFQEKLPKFSNQVDTLASELEPLRTAIDGICLSLNKMSDWKMDKFISLIEKISNMSDKEKKIMMFFMEHQDVIE